MAERDIGWKVSLSRFDRRKSQLRISSEDVVEVIEESLEKNSFDEGVLEIYENPDAMDVLISKLAETKVMVESH